jgi:Gpi18-like mannosyltransferase
MNYNEMIEILNNSKDKIVGIKIYTGYQNINFNNQDFNNKMQKILKLANKYNLPIMFHTGYMVEIEKLLIILYY